MKSIFSICFLISMFFSVDFASAYNPPVEKSLLEKAKNWLGLSNEVTCPNPYISDATIPYYYKDIDTFAIYFQYKESQFREAPQYLQLNNIKEKLKVFISNYYSHCSDTYKVMFPETIDDPIFENENTLAVYIFLTYNNLHHTAYGEMQKYRRGFMDFKILGNTQFRTNVVKFDLEKDGEPKINTFLGGLLTR